MNKNNAANTTTTKAEVTHVGRFESAELQNGGGLLPWRGHVFLFRVAKEKERDTEIGRGGEIRADVSVYNSQKN